MTTKPTFIEAITSLGSKPRLPARDNMLDAHAANQAMPQDEQEILGKQGALCVTLNTTNSVLQAWVSVTGSNGERTQVHLGNTQPRLESINLTALPVGEGAQPIKLSAVRSRSKGWDIIDERNGEVKNYSILAGTSIPLGMCTVTALDVGRAQTLGVAVR